VSADVEPGNVKVRQCAGNLVTAADKILDDLNNLIAARDQLWGTCNVLAWIDTEDDAADWEAHSNTFQRLLADSHRDTLDGLLDLIAGRVAHAVHYPDRRWQPKPVSAAKAYRHVRRLVEQAAR
jgi:hypothetical protein